MTIINVQHRKGATTEAYTAKISYHKMEFKVVYDCQTGNLIIDKWYLLDEGELGELRNRLVTYFQRTTGERKAS